MVSATIRQHEPHSFLVLPENKLAVAAVKTMVPGAKRVTHSVLGLIGPSGTGKSHLCRDLARGWREKQDDAKIISVTASQYGAELAEASDAGAISQFQSKYRRDTKLLIFEDIQALQGRKETQQQLVAAVDEIVDNGGRVVFTSNRMPGEIRNLNRRLASRIRGGLVAELAKPSEASRRKLLLHYLSHDSIRLDAQEVELIAAEIEGSARDLLGILNRVKSEQASRRAANFDIRHILNDRPEIRVTLQDCAKASAKIFGLRVSDLRSPRRASTVTLARQVAMYLARELSGSGYQAIGEYFERKNHSTVIYACQKIQELLTEDAKLAHDVALARKRILGQD